MVVITKAEAKRRHRKQNTICGFHLKYPDQEAIQGGSCPDCVIIRDSCGCGMDSSCEVCNPELREDLVAGGIDLGISKCIICCEETHQKAGYAGVYCFKCKRTYSCLDEGAEGIARLRRGYLKMTKKQVADKLGLSKHTIHSYEWRHCPEKYLHQLEKIINEERKNKVKT